MSGRGDDAPYLVVFPLHPAKVIVFPKANVLVFSTLSTLLVAVELFARWLKPKAGEVVILSDVVEVGLDVLDTLFMTYPVQTWVGPPLK